MKADSPGVTSHEKGERGMMDCHKCEHYYVTWDKQFPHGCKAMKFKSKQLPSVVVFTSSSMECLLFKEKAIFRRRRKDQASDNGKRDG